LLGSRPDQQDQREVEDRHHHHRLEGTGWIKAQTNVQ